MTTWTSDPWKIGTHDSKKFRCCNHPDRPARLPSHVLCAECFAGLDKKMNALFQPHVRELRASADGKGRP